MTTIDTRTHMSRELATKQPAQVAQTPQAAKGRTIDGHFAAVRGGVSGKAMFRVCLAILFLSLFAGFLLSLLTQHH